ncbi:---NA--- [Paramuricea clavata]|uniref:---NA n=1 Tax=Paramuricea clavata TaxID=317549 RepID=A0A6S7GAE1_PARCT|nr:---NA--- [Paramuricea clavata]
MKLAILAFEKKELSIRKAAVVLGVPKDSLNHRVKGTILSLTINWLVGTLLLESPVVDHGELSSPHVSFSMIMKLPSLTVNKKSKRSEEPEIITSSTYKQSLVENMIEQNKKTKQKRFDTEKKAKKLKVQQPKAKGAKIDTRKARKTKNFSTDTVEDSQCVMDFGRIITG